MIKEILLKCGNNFSEISKGIPDVSDIYELINTSINDDVGISVRR